MKRCLVWGAVFFTGWTFSVFAENTFTNGESVCFFGDSITHGGSFHRYIFDYYLTRFPRRSVQWWNAGIGGDSAGGAKRRLQEDVLARKPTSVVVMFGMNDVGRGNFVATPSERQLQLQRGAAAGYRTNMEWLLRRITDAVHPRLLLCTPSPFDQTAFNAAGNNYPHCNDGLVVLAESVKDLARQYHAEVIDFHTPMTAFTLARQKINPSYSLTSGDRVHPGAPGHLLMAWLFLKAQQAPSLVSFVTVDATQGVCAKAENATVEKISVSSNAVTFTVLEGALPFPVAREAAPMLNEIPFTQEMNREILEVKGLSAGVWTLQIDGRDLGRFDEFAFANGINLALLETPAMKQSRSVSALTAQRDGIEKKLRNYAAARWILGHWGVDANDMAAVRKYAATKMSKKGWFEENCIPQYIANWEKRGEIIAQIRDLDKKASDARHPVAHLFRLVK